MKTRSLTDFIEAIDNDRPTPGGGAVAPYVGALATALMRMGGHISFKKDLFLKAPDDQKEFILEAFNKLKVIETQLLDLMNEDMSAYQRVMTAIKLPKEDPLRKETITKMLVMAFDVPYRMASYLLEAFWLSRHIDPFVEGPLRSDVFVSYALLKGALIGSAVTMKANLTPSTRPLLHDKWLEIRQKIMLTLTDIESMTIKELGE